jgi:general secretion pathway protein D
LARKPIALPPAAAAETFIGDVPNSSEAGVTIIGGEAPVPLLPLATQDKTLPGDIRLNFPSADVRVVAKAVLGDLLRIPYTVTPGVTNQVSLVTPGPIARSSVFLVFENALKTAGLALVPQNGGFTVMTIQSAQSSGVTGPTNLGYSTEIIRLQFINAEELKKLLDSVIPNAVTSIDLSSNTITIAGTGGQRSSARDLIKQFDVNWLRNMAFAYFTPQRTDARLIVPELEKLINAPDAPTRGLVRLIAMERLNGIIAVSAQRQYLEDVRRWIDVLDREGTNNEARLFVYKVQNGRSKDLAKTLNSAFGNGGQAGGADQSADPTAAAPVPKDSARNSQISNTPDAGQKASDRSSQNSSSTQSGSQRGPQVSITSDDNNNAVIIFGSPRDYAIVEDALRKLDVPPYQVLIEAAITEVTLTDDLRFGVQWNFQTGDSNFALSEGTGPSPTRILPGFSYFLSGNNISAALNALEERTNVKVVSAPKLVVLNNQTASLQVGDQVPIQTQSAQSVENPNAPIVNAIEYRDTGVILKVTPRVNAGGLVLLDIAQEVSDISSRSVQGISSPIISTRRVSTTVAVQDGQVITLGGLFRDANSFGKNGLPILSRIPILGGLLFGNQKNTQNRTELIILIKPHVLRTADDARAVTEELRAKLRTLEPFKTEGRIP